MIHRYNKTTSKDSLGIQIGKNNSTNFFESSLDWDQNHHVGFSLFINILGFLVHIINELETSRKGAKKQEDI